MTNVTEDRFVHKQFPFVRESVLSPVFESGDWEALTQYLRDQGIEVRQ